MWNLLAALRCVEGAGTFHSARLWTTYDGRATGPAGCRDAAAPVDAPDAHRRATSVRPVRADPTGLAGPTPGAAAGPKLAPHLAGLPRPGRRWTARDRSSEPWSSRSGCRPAARSPAGPPLRLAGANFFDGLAPTGGRAAGAAGRRRPQDPRRRRRSCVSREPLDAGEVVLRHGIPLHPRARARSSTRCAGARTVVRRWWRWTWPRRPTWSPSRRWWPTPRSHSRWRRTHRVSWALRHASELSRSPNETRMRLIWVLDARLPAPLVNQDVFDRTGRLIGVADLLRPRRRIGRGVRRRRPPGRSTAQLGRGAGRGLPTGRPGVPHRHGTRPAPAWTRGGPDPVDPRQGALPPTEHDGPGPRNLHRAGPSRPRSTRSWSSARSSRSCTAPRDVLWNVLVLHCRHHGQERSAARCQEQTTVSLGV